MISIGFNVCQAETTIWDIGDALPKMQTTILTYGDAPPKHKRQTSIVETIEQVCGDNRLGFAETTKSLVDDNLMFSDAKPRPIDADDKTLGRDDRLKPRQQTICDADAKTDMQGLGFFYDDGDAS